MTEREMIIKGFTTLLTPLILGLVLFACTGHIWGIVFGIVWIFLMSYLAYQI